MKGIPELSAVLYVKGTKLLMNGLGGRLVLLTTTKSDDLNG